MGDRQHHFEPVQEELAFRMFSFQNFGGAPDDAVQDAIRRTRWKAMADADAIVGFDMNFGRDHYRKGIAYVTSGASTLHLIKS